MSRTYFEQVMKNLTDKNFDNDIARIVTQSHRYNLGDGPIRIGTQPIIGSLAEGIIETARMLDTLAADFEKKIEGLEKRISELEKDKQGIEYPEDTKEKKAPKKAKEKTASKEE